MGLPSGSTLIFSENGLQLYDYTVGVGNVNGGLNYTTQVYGVTGAGVQLLETLPGVTSLFDVNAVGGRVMFETITTVGSGGTQPTRDTTTLYGTDGTAGGTQLLVSLPNVTGVFNVLTVNGRNIFYTLSDNTDGSQNAAVYGTDATAGGTKVIANLLGGNGTSVLPTAFFADTFDFVFQDLIAHVSNNAISYETRIFESDGTPSGTHLEWDLQNTYGVTRLPSPLISPPAQTSVPIKSPTAITGIGVLQLNTGSQVVSTTLTSSHGTLSTSGGAGTITGSGTTSLTLSGTLAQVDADLAALRFTGTHLGTGSITAVASYAGVSSPAATWNVTVSPVPPVVTDHTSDQTWTAGQQTLFKLAADTFTDQQGSVLFYSASLASGAPLPSWLVFNANHVSFSGTAPSGTQTLALKVTVTDTYSATASETFNLHIAAAAAPHAIAVDDVLHFDHAVSELAFDPASDQLSRAADHAVFPGTDDVLARWLDAEAGAAHAALHAHLIADGLPGVA